MDERNRPPLRLRLPTVLRDFTGRAEAADGGLYRLRVEATTPRRFWLEDATITTERVEVSPRFTAREMLVYLTGRIDGAERARLTQRRAEARAAVAPGGCPSCAETDPICTH